MSIIVNLDVMMAKKKISSQELADKIGITQENLSLLKKNKGKWNKSEYLQKRLFRLTFPVVNWFAFLFLLKNKEFCRILL